MIKEQYQESREILWWLNKAMTFIRPEVPNVYTRMIKVDENDPILNYFQAGKVFQWRNFSSAYKGKLEPNQESDNNLIFYIYGRNCKSLNQFVASKNQEFETYMFPMLSSFLVCKVE